MIADLHFHPCFFNKGSGKQITQWRFATPRLEKVVETAMLDKKVGILTITSCSTHEHHDPRWEEYMQELQEGNLDKYYRVEKHPQALKISTIMPVWYGHGPVIEDRPLYLFHGQELKTDHHDLNVLFAEQNVPIQRTNGKFQEVIAAARDSGDNVLIGINQLGRHRADTMKEDCRELSKLYEAEKLHFIETYNSMDSRGNNLYADKVAWETGIPRVAVSDAHRLRDMANGSTVFNVKKDLAIDTIPVQIKYALDHNCQALLHQEQCGISSKVLYAARLGEAIYKPKFLQL